MSAATEFESTPKLLFTTRTNTELGAESVAVGADGSIELRGVLKQVTESMLTSYPRTLLGKWTPNRASVRYARDEIGERRVRDFATGEALGADALAAMAR
ncbi:MAG: hypothetical protein R3E88_13240 [Myxococcota bacterium]|nr:hypothetical protein [Myxococcales bacterium]